MFRRIAVSAASKTKILSSSFYQVRTVQPQLQKLVLASLRFHQTSTEEKLPLAKVEAKLALGFTCKPCGHRVNRFISKVAYTRGLVLVRCPGCKNVHLIADHIGWFKDLAPRVKNIEEILAARGESIRTTLEADEIFEVGDIPAASSAAGTSGKS